MPPVMVRLVDEEQDFVLLHENLFPILGDVLEVKGDVDEDLSTRRSGSSSRMISNAVVVVMWMRVVVDHLGLGWALCLAPTRNISRNKRNGKNVKKFNSWTLFSYIFSLLGNGSHTHTHTYIHTPPGWLAELKTRIFIPLQYIYPLLAKDITSFFLFAGTWFHGKRTWKKEEKGKR